MIVILTILLIVLREALRLPKQVSKVLSAPTDEIIDIPINIDSSRLTFFSRHHHPLSPLSYLGMKYARLKERLDTWRDANLTVEEPITESPTYILSSYLHMKGNFENTQVMVEVKRSSTDGVLPRLNAWPYQRRKREHFSKREHARLAYPKVKEDAIATFVTPFVDMARNRIAEEEQAWGETIQVVKNFTHIRKP